VVHLVDGIGSYLSTSDISQLFYTNLVYDTNTVSIFNLFAVFALFECFINSKSTKWNWILGVVLAFLTLYMLMLQSRIIIFSMLLGYVVLFFVYWKSVKKWALVALLLFSGALFLIPAFQGRFGSVVEQSQAIEATTENQPVDAPAPTNIYINDCSTSTSLRYYALISSLEVIKNNPIFGVGTGDWRDELVKVYHKNELRCNIKEETAPHNQYVRTVLKFGVIGFLFFGFLFLQFMLKSLREKAIGQASIVISVLLAAVGYDLLDGGGTAPFVAFFLFLLFPSSSFSSNNQLKP
jgi:O-antigen ligase